MLHFPYLRQHCEKNNSTVDADMCAFMTWLIENFSARFENFKFSSELLLFLCQLFSVSANGQWTAEAKKLLPSLDEGSLQLEVVELLNIEVLKAQNMFLLTMFAPAYICDSGFSMMNLNKNQQRIRITDEHLHQCLCIATTSYQPDFRRLASTRHSHVSR
ncbi:hypothetical protein EOD39_9075 [Acipenser ruthenus]|uniref:Uncharacterized protein n=1 Tax=Acipenser ruthenus TaxID=7906 RepID=A0A444U1S7_ACIRT|nr:hypothetical protein EOD39_9075 [Acipenser ruthenus]